MLIDEVFYAGRSTAELRSDLDGQSLLAKEARARGMGLVASQAQEEIDKILDELNRR